MPNTQTNKYEGNKEAHTKNLIVSVWAFNCKESFGYCHTQTLGISVCLALFYFPLSLSAPLYLIPNNDNDAIVKKTTMFEE